MSKLQVVQKSKAVFTESDLEKSIHLLELCAGDITEFCNRSGYEDSSLRPLFLFDILKELEAHPDLKERWTRAVALGHRVRVEMIREKAFRMLMNFKNTGTSSAPEISYCKFALDQIVGGALSQPPAVTAKSKLDEIEESLAG